MSDKREQALERAARDLETEALRQAASQLSGPVARLMDQVAGALEGSDRGAAPGKRPASHLVQFDVSNQRVEQFCVN